jgi:hypothetical protein
VFEIITMRCKRYFVLLLAFVLEALADCQSYGIDFTNGGSYFQNLSATDDLTFVTQFEGCEGEGSITPLLVNPNKEEHFCSDIATSPDDTSFNSTW